MLRSVYRNPLRPARKTACRFMPKPSPTTDACNRNLENRADSRGKGWVKTSPNASPIARATGGDANPLAAHSRPRKKNTFEIMLGRKPGSNLFPVFRKYLRGRARSQRLDRFLFCIVHFEDCQQLGDLEQIAYALRQIRQFDRSSRIVGCRVESYQCPQPARIDVAHAAAIENEFVRLGEQLLHRVAEFGRFLSKYDTAIAIHHQDAVHLPSSKFELHTGTSPCALKNSVRRKAYSLRGRCARDSRSKKYGCVQAWEATSSALLRSAKRPPIAYNRDFSSMSYQVLARKYRPQKFSEVIGQEHVTRTLKNAIEQGRTAHGYIFSGHRGIGKTTVARILAMALNCRSQDHPVPEPCGICESCTEIRAGNSVDVIEIDAATNRGIDEIRELREAARYRPARDRFKIYILDEAHQITDAAFNALLKTLEEPPSHVVFMLATTQPEDIPQTIRSRCQHFSFHAVRFEDVLNQLRSIVQREGIAADDNSLALLARAGDGSMRDALSILDQAIACCGDKLTVEIVRELVGAAPSHIIEELMQAVSRNSSEDALRIVDKLL